MNLYVDYMERVRTMAARLKSASIAIISPVGPFQRRTEGT